MRSGYRRTKVLFRSSNFRRCIQEEKMLQSLHLTCTYIKRNNVTLSLLSLTIYQSDVFSRDFSLGYRISFSTLGKSRTVQPGRTCVIKMCECGHSISEISWLKYLEIARIICVCLFCFYLETEIREGIDESLNLNNDQGGFKYSQVNPRVFEFANKLLLTSFQTIPKFANFWNFDYFPN